MAAEDYSEEQDDLRKLKIFNFKNLYICVFLHFDLNLLHFCHFSKFEYIQCVGAPLSSLNTKDFFVKTLKSYNQLKV